MIVCHCMNITDRDIHTAIDWMRAADDTALITPGRLYAVLGKSADCGGCMPLFLETIRGNANTPVPRLTRPVAPQRTTARASGTRPRP